MKKKAAHVRKKALAKPTRKAAPLSRKERHPTEGTKRPKALMLAGEVGVGRRVMKKWLPLVPGPALAMENMPGLVCFRPGKPIKEGADSGASRK